MAQRGLKAADLSRLTGIPSQRFTEWKNSTPERPRVPTLSQALRIARALGVPLDYLADDDLDDPTSLAELGIDPDDRTLLEFLRITGLSRQAVMRAILDAVRREAESPG
jgi:transcriptional regulator with XRE-family HTH domain